jgi:site-specific DNA-cytosine methylase
VELTHASFFSGVGGLDLGLEHAGWRTVSFSEIDPYALAILERHTLLPTRCTLRAWRWCVLISGLAALPPGRPAR